LAVFEEDKARDMKQISPNNSYVDQIGISVSLCYAQSSWYSFSWLIWVHWLCLLSVLLSRDVNETLGYETETFGFQSETETFPRDW